MTKAEIKRILGKVDELDMLIRIVDAKIERYESMTQGHAIRYDSIRVQSTPEDPVEQAMERLYSLLDERKKLQTKRMVAIEAAEALIDLVSDAKMRQVLCYRYLNGLSWYSVSRRVGHAERYTFCLHDKAIDEIFQKKHKKT